MYNIVHQASDEELTTELFSQDSCYSNTEIISGVTSDSDVSTRGQHAVSQTDQPVITMVTEGRQTQSHSTGRFALESDHVALKNNSECVMTLLYISCLCCIMAEFVKGVFHISILMKHNLCTF